MKQISQLYRLIHIQFIFAKHGLDEIVFATGMFTPIRFLIYLNPWNWWRDKSTPRGQRIRQALEELGPIFVKFGQMLSTRPDLIPEDIAQDLTYLQDKVSPFPHAKQILEKIYGTELENIFKSFSPTPLASASIAQVHEAELETGQKVVVKVLRPKIKKIIRRDIALMYTFAKLTERYWPGSRRLRPREIVSEFEHTLLNELDLTREAANASQLRRNFMHSPLLYIPEVYWSHTRLKVMVMERISGIPVANIEALKQNNIDLKKLAERGVEIFFTQVFRDCFFHADMHPGNIFVAETSGENPQYIAVDFGIIGTLNPVDQRYLAENILAFFNRDYYRVAQLHIDSGWVPPNTRVDEFESAIRTVCEPIFERPLKDISCGQLLLRLFQTGKRFNMEVQPQLLLLQKTLIHIEGLGRQLYPELDLWSTAKPFLERWLKEQVGVKAFMKKMKNNVPYLMERLPEVPGLIFNTLQHFQQQELRQSQLTQNYQKEKDRLTQQKKAGFLSGMGTALLASALILLLFTSTQETSPLLILLGACLGIAGLSTFLIAKWFNEET